MARKWFGNSQSQSSADKVKPPPLPIITSADAKKFGLENFGNTCYANSVIQALYFCAPFRDLLIQSPDASVPQASAEQLAPPNAQPLPSPITAPRKPERKPSISGAPSNAVASLQFPNSLVMSIPTAPPSLFSALRSLFVHISTNPSDKGTVAPRAFIDKLKDVNELFRSTMHQDAHEFFNYLLNKVVEEIEAERRHTNGSSSVEDLSNSIATLASRIAPTTVSTNSGTPPEVATLVHKLFEGTLTSETRCLTCETVSSRDESFLDLSIDIEQNSSVTACLRQFSASEMLCHRNKFFCDSCCDLQEAERRMKIKKLPNVLALHLKRFKYQEDVRKYIKLAYRVAFPLQLRLFNTVDDAEDADRLYNLFAIVVHIGSGPHHGHYISIIKTLGTWLVFDDDNVHPIPESDIPKYYGENNAGSAYVLYYEAADIDPPSLGIRTPDVAMSTASVIPTSEAPPAFSSPQPPTPVLPPSLTEEGDSSDLSDPPFPITPSQSYSPVLPLDAEISPLPSKVDDPVSSSPALVPAIHSANGRGMGILNSMRRTPSTQPQTAIKESDHPEAQLLADLVPTLHSGDGPDDSSVTSHGHEHGSSSSTPPLIPQAPKTPKTSKENEKYYEKEKEPSRKPSGWFKRRSLRAERPKTSHDHQIPASPKPPTDETTTFQSTSTSSSNASSTAWYKPSTKDKTSRKTTEPNGYGSRPKSSGGVLTIKPSGDRRSVNDHSDTPPSATSSVGSANYTFPASSPHAHSHIDAPPPRKSSLANIPPIDTSQTSPRLPPPPQSPQTPSSYKSTKSPDHKLSLSNLPGRKSRKASVDIARPSTAPGTHADAASAESRPLPPVPPLPPGLATPMSPKANGDAHPRSPIKERDTTPPDPPLYRPATADPSTVSPGLHTFAGQNSSSGSAASGPPSTQSNSTTSNFKRATRKLSISSPFGFGRKDKDKEREKDKDRRERERHPPPSFGFTIS
ncbi:hypothetical protein V5O48_012300 [Marasmius crinis-equi]|uniref:Ubiquitin carboxyl-terminal hydrolase n=1 Tax=Marasmius crinis-equi TaxID=585013 RepID=A0ABR3F3G2_9AGAR